MGSVAESMVGAHGRGEAGALMLPSPSSPVFTFAPPMFGCPGSWGFSNDQSKPAPAVLECVAELGEMVNKTLCQLLVSAME